jgi:hypothetical protein
MIELMVNATTIANNVAQKRRVYAFAQSETGTVGRKRLTLTEAGLFADPACATAATLQHYRGAYVDRRIGRRLIARGARRRAAESRLRAQCVASNDASQTLVSRMEQQARELLTRANARLEELKGRLRAEKLYPESMNIQSTASHILLSAVSRDSSSFAATSPPPISPAAGDLAVRLHQSAVNNLLTQRLGGIKIDNDYVVAKLEEFKLEVPAELRPTPKNADPNSGPGAGEQDDDEKWSLTFDPDLPASVTFDDNLVKISVRGRKFTRGAREVKDRIEISADYRLLRTTDGNFVAERTGDLEVRFVDVKRKLSPTQLSYKVFLERKFSALFKDRITSYEFLDRPGMERLNDLCLNQIGSARGWLATSLSLRPGVRLRKQT